MTRSVWEPGHFNDADRAFRETFDRHADALMRAFQQSRQPQIHPRAGLRTLELADMNVRSFAYGERIRSGASDDQYV